MRHSHEGTVLAKGEGFSDVPKYSGMMSSIRLVAFNIASWCPTQAQFGRAMACIQPDERERIRKFRYLSTNNDKMVQ